MCARAHAIKNRCRIRVNAARGPREPIHVVGRSVHYARIQLQGCNINVFLCPAAMTAVDIVIRAFQLSVK